MLFRLPIVKFFNRILNRITVTVVLVALQLAWLAWVFFALTTGAARVWVTGVLNGLSLLIILYLVRKDENSAYKVGWIALIGLLPLLGGALYLAFGNKRPSRRLRSKMQAVEQAHRADRAQQPGQAAGLCDENRGVSRYLTQYGCYPAWQNTTARYFSCGEAMYPQLLADLEKAEKSIFLEFFIVSHGCMWNGIEKILRRKAAAGLDVRVTQSGEFTGTRQKISKRGSPYLRRAIWLAASRAAFCDPILSEYYQGLRARGKHHLTAVGAVSRKLCNTIYTILKEDRPWQPIPPKGKKVSNYTEE